MEKHEHKWNDHVGVCDCPFCPISKDCDCGAYVLPLPMNTKPSFDEASLEVYPTT